MNFNQLTLGFFIYLPDMFPESKRTVFFLLSRSMEGSLDLQIEFGLRQLYIIFNQMFMLVDMLFLKMTFFTIRMTPSVRTSNFFNLSFYECCHSCFCIKLCDRDIYSSSIIGKQFYFNGIMATYTGSMYRSIFSLLKNQINA